MAVSAASPGDEILVASGLYNGTVSINKSLSLIGQGSSTTVIDAKGSGPGINITQTNGVTVSGFAIRNTDVVDSGVLISTSYNVTVSGNLIQASSQSNGTYVTNSYFVTLTANNITGNVYGIAIQGGSANRINGNNVTGNSADAIGIFSSEANKIADNQLRKSQKGLEMNYGSTGNLIARNLISNNTFGLWIQNSTQDVIVENKIDFNNRAAPPLQPTGIRLSSTSGNMIYYNNIRNNTVQIYADSGGDIVRNTWNDGGSKPKGNFWSDYHGVDNDLDGIGDTMLPWPCPTAPGSCSYSGPAGVDYYPLMRSWKSSPLAISAIARPASGCPGSQGLQVALSSSSAKGGVAPYTYSWKFGDGTSASGQNVTHSYIMGGSFFPKVTAIDNTGFANGTDLAVVTVFSGGVQLKVSDQTGSPITSANITSLTGPAQQVSFVVMTDNQGLARIACLVPGGYRVQVSHAGYKTMVVGFQVSNVTSTVSVALTTLPGTVPPLWWVLYGGVGTAVAIGLLVAIFRRRRKSVQSPSMS
jgi:parallel beta-helix repeat protein